MPFSSFTKELNTFLCFSFVSPTVFSYFLPSIFSGLISFSPNLHVSFCVLFDIKSIVVWRKLFYNFDKNSLLSFFPICFIKKNLRILASSSIFWRVLPCRFINPASLSLGWEETFFRNTTSLLLLFCFVL